MVSERTWVKFSRRSAGNTALDELPSSSLRGAWKGETCLGGEILGREASLKLRVRTWKDGIYWHPKKETHLPTPVFQKHELLVSGRVLEKILKNWTMLPLKAWEKGEICGNGHRNLIQTIVKQLQLDIQKLNYFYLWLEHKNLYIWTLKTTFPNIFCSPKKTRFETKITIHPPINPPTPTNSPRRAAFRFFEGSREERLKRLEMETREARQRLQQRLHALEQQQVTLLRRVGGGGMYVYLR